MAMAAIARSFRSSATRSSLTQLLSRRFISSDTTFCLVRAAAIPLAEAGSVQPYRFGTFRYMSQGPGGDPSQSPLPKSGPGTGSVPNLSASELESLFPGCDYEHWLIVMDKPGGENATKQQMIDCYIQTLAKIVGSEEEAKKKIYNVSCERYFGFGCEIDRDTSNKLEGLPGVLFVLPDAYVDPEYKDYGAELLVNGEIVQRPPERQRRVEIQPQRNQDRPRNNNRRR
ncbi:multiple organellar RNA editing factor [Rhynchospora pubera]|uniref:Multiple organellar RNA editing factor n=1 Tax=Rhynchospora pubera TaxID=906938 RepID=A0AAV8E9A3_9POAL|nr:multiple organellar RNA editing factor [Rhynchospora pubera]